MKQVSLIKKYIISLLWILRGKERKVMKIRHLVKECVSLRGEEGIREEMVVHGLYMCTYGNITAKPVIFYN